MGAKAAKLEIGDRVLVKILAYDGKHKIADKWTENGQKIYIYIYIYSDIPYSDIPYSDISDIPNVIIPVYKVEREDGKGCERMLHRDNLLHLGSSLAGEVKEPDKNNSSVDIEGLTNSSTRASPTPTPRNLKTLPTPKPRYKKLEIETEEEEDDSLFVVTKTTDTCVNEISEVDDELVVDYATCTQENNVSTHKLSDYMDNEDAHDPDQTDGLSENENVDTEEETLVKVVPEPRRLLSADATENEGNTPVDTSDNAAENIIQRSIRFKQKPLLWQRQGDFVMLITERSAVLQSLLSPYTLSQLEPDTVFAIVKGVIHII